MKSSKRNAPPMVGTSSLLIIFAVLCLTVFSLLTLSTAKADQRLSAVSADTVTAYYAADLQAETILAQLRSGQIPEGVTVDGSVYSYTCKISETQTLIVEVSLVENSWEILRWQSVSSNR